MVAAGGFAALLLLLGLELAWQGAGAADLAASPAASPAPAKSDAQLLLDFKASLVNGDAALPSWQAGSDPCAGWVGVRCSESSADGQRLVEMNLGRGLSERLQGTIPPPGGWELPTSLLSINLAGQSFSGPFPEAGWSLLPASLQTLYMHNNSLAGTVPQQWGASLPLGLSSISLYNNLLTGTLPAWADASSTSIFILPGNDGLCGSVPTSPQYLSFTPTTSISGIGVATPDYTVKQLPPCVSPAPAPSPPAPASSPAAALVVADSPAPATQAPANVAPSGGGGGSSTPVVAGAVGGVVGALVLAALLGWWALRRRRKRRYGALAKAQNRADLDKILAADPLLASIVSKLGALAPTSASSGSSGSSTGAKSQPQAGAGAPGEPELYTIPFHELQLLKLIGEGSFGRVYAAKWNETQVAAKLLLGTSAEQGGPEAAAEQALSLSNPVLQKLKEEAGLMASLRHPHVVSFLGVCIAPPLVVSELCARGSLSDILSEARHSPTHQRQLDWRRRLRLAIDAAKGMLYLHAHQPPILHRDFKSPNILVTKAWTAKVADFNLSKIMLEEAPKVAGSSLAAANPRWLAPEVLSGESHSFASDVFSFGVVSWELLSFKFPWMHVANPWQVAKLVMDGQRPELPPDRSELPGAGGAGEGLEPYIALLQRCWAQQPQERPGFAEIIGELRRLLALAEQQAQRARGGGGQVLQAVVPAAREPQQAQGTADAV